MTDRDRAGVYSAEWIVQEQCTVTTVTVHGTRVTIPVVRKFADLPDVQRYVDRVLALNWVRERWNPGPVKVERSRVINKAKCGGGKMLINPDHDRWQLSELIVLHELSHHLAGGGHGHDAEFRRTYLALLEELVGAEVAWLLRIAYDDAGLHTPVYT